MWVELYSIHIIFTTTWNKTEAQNDCARKPRKTKESSSSSSRQRHHHRERFPYLFLLRKLNIWQGNYHRRAIQVGVQQQKLSLFVYFIPFFFHFLLLLPSVSVLIYFYLITHLFYMAQQQHMRQSRSHATYSWTGPQMPCAANTHVNSHSSAQVKDPAIQNERNV